VEDKKKAELFTQLNKKLHTIDKQKFTGKLTMEINCIDGRIGNYFSKVEAEEPNKILST